LGLHSLALLRDYYVSIVCNRMNEIMKVLTIIATIFMDRLGLGWANHLWCGLHGESILQAGSYRALLGYVSGDQRPRVWK
jgi:hypothetical protein